MEIQSISNHLISQIGVKDKYLRRGHYNTLKTWWARRPITAMRAILIREMVRSKGFPEFSVPAVLLTELNPPRELLEKFSNRFGTHELKVLDVFAGGGSIPFEASRLGFQSISSELNPVASLLQETIFDGLTVSNFSELLRLHGTSVINRLRENIGHLYKIAGKEPYVYFWEKTAICKKCGEELNLGRLQFLAKKKNKTVTMTRSDQKPKVSNSQGIPIPSQRKGRFICTNLNCQEEHSFKDIKVFCKQNKLGNNLLALCDYNNGKDYYILSEKENDFLSDLMVEIELRLKKNEYLIPDEEVKSKSGVINPTLYDLKTHSDFFNPRQRLVLTELIKELVSEYQTIKDSHSPQTAKQVILSLGSLIEFLVDWNSNGTMWIPQNEQTGRSLAGPGVGMKWDYIELNPFFHKGSNLYSKLDRVANTYEAIARINPISILKGSSEKLALPDASIDFVFTDPPYFDSVDYTALSEFFRPWFEVLISNTYDSQVDLRNDISNEAIVDLSNSKKRGAHHYEKLMTGVLTESNRVLKSDGKLLLLYSHKTIEGWKSIAIAFKQAQFKIKDFSPLEMERIARPRAMNYMAINGVILFEATKDDDIWFDLDSEMLILQKRIDDSEVLESQIPIYLAALAVKQFCSDNKAFADCYTEIQRHFEKFWLENLDFTALDSISIAYLKTYSSPLQEIPFPSKQLLEANELLKNGELLPIRNICSFPNLKDTGIYWLSNTLKQFENSTKTKITVNKKMISDYSKMLMIFAGSRLNSVKVRSDSGITQATKLILSKMESIA